MKIIPSNQDGAVVYKRGTTVQCGCGAMLVRFLADVREGRPLTAAMMQPLDTRMARIENGRPAPPCPSCGDQSWWYAL